MSDSDSDELDASTLVESDCILPNPPQQVKKEHVLPFPEPTKQTMLSLYRRGMTGWGKQKANLIDIAKEETGLDLNQIKVLCMLLT